MKVGSVAYLPPPGVAGVESFVKNIVSYNTEHPITFYSDTPEAYPELDVKRIPDVPKTVLYRNLPLSANNSAYVRGIELAHADGLEFFLYLESDCRVRGDGWDGKLFDEFFGQKDCLVGGTPSVFNMGLAPANAALRMLKFINSTVKRTGRLPLIWQTVSRDGHAPPFAFPNGAGGIYETSTVNAAFGGRKYDWGSFVANMGAWDVFVGRALHNQFGLELFDRFALLPSMYSGYKDVHYSLADRQKMMMSGEIVLMHQCKTAWQPDL